jgi:hypothetical protein
MTKYFFYYGIKNIDESYKKEIIGLESNEPKQLENLINVFKELCKICANHVILPEQKPNPNIRAPKNIWIQEGFGGPLG